MRMMISIFLLPMFCFSAKEVHAVVWLMISSTRTSFVLQSGPNCIALILEVERRVQGVDCFPFAESIVVVR